METFQVQTLVNNYTLLMVSACVLTKNTDMSQLNARPKRRVEKTDTNPKYRACGRDGEVDYAVDHNQDYQPFDYDEIYDTSRENSSKVRQLYYTMITQ